MKKYFSLLLVSLMLVSALTFNVSAADKSSFAVSDMSTSAETAVIRMELPLKMAIRFENGNVYYGGERVKIDVGVDYRFQMCTVNWENGIFDDSGNGICGTVVYSMKALQRADFYKLREAALQDTARYTVKGDDVIDNVEKKIFVNCGAEDFHLETDVNNFFMAYRFSFENGNYNKKTRINGVVNSPVESLSVNLPLGATVNCEAVVNGTTVKTASIFVERNSGEGIYSSEYLTSVNDYNWDTSANSDTGNNETPVYYDSSWSDNQKIKGYAAAMNAILNEIGKNYRPAEYGYLFGAKFGEYGVYNPYYPEGSSTAVFGEMYSIKLEDLDNSFIMVAPDGNQKTDSMRTFLTQKGLSVEELRSENGIAKYAPFVLMNSNGEYLALFCRSLSSAKYGTMYYPDGNVVEIHHTNRENTNFLDNVGWDDMAYYAQNEAEAVSVFGTK